MPPPKKLANLPVAAIAEVAAVMTDRQMLERIEAVVASLVDEFRTLTATLGLLIGDAQSFNRRMTAVEARIAVLEQRSEAARAEEH